MTPADAIALALDMDRAASQARSDAAAATDNDSRLAALGRALQAELTAGHYREQADRIAKALTAHIDGV